MTHSPDIATGHVAAVCDPRTEHAESMKRFVESQGWVDVRWHSPRDVSDLEQAIRLGGVHRLLFYNVNVLLTDLWSEELPLDRWLDAGVVIEFVEAPPSSDAPTAPMLRDLARHYHEWNRIRRRRQVVAGAMLSALVLIAAFLLLFYFTPAR
jgi:hypothetical protein